MVYEEARYFITNLIQMNRDLDTELRIQFIQNKHAPHPFNPLGHSWTDITHEIRVGKDGSWEFLNMEEARASSRMETI